MLDKHSSARSLAFVFSEISMRNCRTLKLLSNPLERDVLVKNSARELGNPPCLHVNHFQSKCFSHCVDVRNLILTSIQSH